MAVNVPITTSYDTSGVNQAKNDLAGFAGKAQTMLDRVAFVAKGVTFAFLGWQVIKRYTDSTRTGIDRVTDSVKKAQDQTSSSTRKMTDNLNKVATVAGGAATALGLVSFAAGRLGNNATQPLQNFTSTATTGFSNLTTALTGVSVGLSVGALVNFGREATIQAAGVGESLNLLSVVLGDSSKKIDEWSKTTTESIGLSRREALDAASNFAIFFKSAGQTSDEAADSSTRFVKLAADLGSIANVPVPDALDKLGAALRGQYEPISSLGVLLNEAEVKAAALRHGIIATDDEALTPAQRTLAAYQAVLEKTAFATDDFAKTQDSLPNRLKKVAAKFDDFKVRIGEQLLPRVLALWDAFDQKILPVLKDLASEWVPFLRDKFQELREKVEPIAKEIADKVVPALKDFGKWIQDHKVEVLVFVGVFTALAVSALLVAGAVSILTAVLNPVVIGIVAVAAVIAALAAGFVYLYRNNETFRNAVTRAWNGIRDTVGRAIGKIRNAFDRFRAAWDLIKDAFDAFKERDWPRFWSAIQGAVRQGFDGVKELLGAGKILFYDWLRDLAVGLKDRMIEVGKDLGRYLIDELVKTIQDPTRIVRAFEKIGEALAFSMDVAVALIASIWNGTLGGFTFRLPDWFGWVIPGLGGASITIPRMSHRWSSSPGGSSGGGAPPEMIGPEFDPPSPGVTMPFSVLSAPMGGAPVVVNVTGALDPVSVANQINNILSGQATRLSYVA